MPSFWRSGGGWAAILSALFLLASCKSDGQQAGELLQKAQAEEQARDYVAALADYRAAVDLDNENTDARRALATLLLRLENLDGARAQFYALSERLPDDVEASLALAEIALARGNADAAEQGLVVAASAAPDDPRTQAAAIAIAYSRASASGDVATATRELDKARLLLTKSPSTFAARRILIRAALDGSDPASAAPDIREALSERPQSVEVNLMRVDLLERTGHSAAALGLLQTLHKIMPERQDVATRLGAHYLADGPVEDAVAFLVERADAGGDALAGHQAAADYVALHVSDAEQQLRDIAANEPAGIRRDIYLARAAELRFDRGDHGGAITDLRALLAPGRPLAAEPAPRVALARMLDINGDHAGAETIVQATLSRNPTDAKTLKLLAQWKIRDGDLSGAITELRLAQTAAPDDSEILTLLGDCYARTGSNSLASKSFAEAVRVSDSGAPESLIFARFLIASDNRHVAETVLREALSRHPTDPALVAFAAKAGLNQKP